MKKPVAYLETSFVSYLTGWVSVDEKVARDQSATVRWWEEERGKWHCVVSDAVFLEARDGDPRAAGRRLAVLQGVEVVPTTGEAVALADTLVRAHALPEKARADAMHVALAAIREADLLLTWNCRHIANPVMLPKIYSTLERAGYKCPAIATPGQLLEGMSNEILDEVHAARERLWQRAGGTMRGLGEYLMECGRRARERGVMWIDSEEELDAIGAEVRARLAREEAMGAVCVGEEREVYGVAGGAATGGTPKECTMQNAECTMGNGGKDLQKERMDCTHTRGNE